MHDQWTRFNRLSPDKFIIAMFQLLYHSLHQPKKDADGNCKLAVETLQDSNLSSKSVFITRSHCFHFVLLVHQCRESLIYIEFGKYGTTASTPHRINSRLSVNLWVLSVPHQVNAR